MDELPVWRHRTWAQKYCGAGWGGYALYLFDTTEERADWLKRASREGHEARAIEPYMRRYGDE